VPEGTDMQALEGRFKEFFFDLVVNGLRKR